METVHEILDALPLDQPSVTLARRESLLLTPGKVMGRPPEARAPIEVVSFSPIYVPKPFSPPAYVYENEETRIEVQDMNGRQPFYHRNLSVDEMSYQVTGPRMLVTELGTVELEPGDFVRIPVGVAHDNWGRNEIHLLFYIQAPVEDQVPGGRRSEPHAFRDWQPATVTEMLGDGDVRIHQTVDEQLLVDFVHTQEQRLNVMRADAQAEGTTWLWKARSIWIGKTTLLPADGAAYRRHRVAEEVQYQISGTRTLVTQDGVVDLHPGDFVKIPIGCAFTSICREGGTYLTMLTSTPLRRVADASRQGVPHTAQQLDELRSAGRSAATFA